MLWVCVCVPFSGLSQSKTSTAKSALDLLNSSSFPSNPILSISDHQHYYNTNSSSKFTEAIIPSRFVLSLEYKPTHTTALRLFSVTVSHPPALTHNVASTLVLSSSMTFVYPSSFFVAWRNFTIGQPNQVAVFVDNSEISFCVNGKYVPPVWNTNLWTYSLSSTETKLNFSQHLQQTQNQVGRYFSFLSCTTDFRYICLL